MNMNMNMNVNMNSSSQFEQGGGDWRLGVLLEQVGTFCGEELGGQGLEQAGRVGCDVLDCLLALAREVGLDHPAGLLVHLNSNNQGLVERQQALVLAAGLKPLEVVAGVQIGYLMGHSELLHQQLLAIVVLLEIHADRGHRPKRVSLHLPEHFEQNGMKLVGGRDVVKLGAAFQPIVALAGDCLFY
jgi:hypothetical protein